MIKLRLSAFTSEGSDKEIPFIVGELADELLKRVLEDIFLYEHKDKFQLILNGHRIDSEFLHTIQIHPTDYVLIAPIIRGGTFGEVFKMIAVIIVVVAVTVATRNPGVGASIASALLAAGAAIGTSLLLNALIPPPVPGGLDFGVGGANSLDSSQMYTISSQSNSVKKFGRVPKTYGRHKVFPNVAANPYNEIEADPNTGELIQYLYAIYDFGLGPNIIEDIKIGDSNISSYSEVTYNLVDFHKPIVSEGVWDDLSVNKLKYYKGDFESDYSSTSLEENQEAGGALSGYQVVRTNAFNSTNSEQEIIITFVNPQGLIAYATTGDTYERSIDVDIEFALKDTGIYRRFNDADFVESFAAVGGSPDNNDVYGAAPGFTPGTPYVLLSAPVKTNLTQQERDDLIKFGMTYYEDWGIPASQNFIILQDNFISINRFIYANGNRLGKVVSIEPHSPGFSKYNLESAIGISVIVYRKVLASPQYDSYGVYTGVTIRNTLETNSPSSTFYRKLEGRFTITRKSTGQVFSTVKFTPKAIGQFDIRITRVRSYSASSFNVQDNLVVASIATRFDRSPILTPNRHTFLELRIRATNQLNGAIQNLSAVCTSVLDVWDGTQWKKEATSNPAWVFTDILTGQINKRAVDKSRLHLPSILEWANFCDQVPTAPTGQFFVTPRFRCNFFLDFNTTVQSIVNQVTNSSQASLNIIDGKYGVLIDKKRTTPVQVFTPRNSKDFSSSRNYTTRPHAVKIKFIDPAADWQVGEKVVYDDGYDFETSTDIDELTSFACTDPDQAWRFGRYMIAQNKLRQETITLNVDFEFLVCTRGDYVQITQDVMKVGGSPARVKSVVGTTITIDDSINTTANPYGYVYRSTSGISTSTLTVVNSDTFIVGGGIPAVGDLIVIGEMGTIVFDCLVKAITPNDDLSAQIFLVEKADAIYDAESTDFIPNYSPQISVTVDTQNLPPAKVTDLEVLENSYLCGANSFEHYIKIDWDVPVGTAFEYFEVYVDDGRGYDIEDTTRDSEYIYFVEDSRLGFSHNFKVVAVSSSGKKLELNSVDTISATPVLKTTRPANVSSLSTNITGEVLQLDWEPVNDCIREYLIRYTPNLAGTWEASIPLLRVDKNTTLASTQARTGTYLIKAVDFNENESQRATVAITTIPELFNLNVISSITDFPTLVGSKDRVVKNGDTLLLKNKEVGGVTINEYFPEGYYYYNGFLDLGDIYTVRLQSLIQAEGYTVEDIMANWVTLNDVVALSNSRFSEWDVQTEYRVTDAFNVMADWVNLSIIDPISEGVQDSWSDWRRFTIGDGTGRIFQFRLKLISNKPSVTPRVFDGTIKADMPDRLVSFENLVAPNTGYQVVYSPAFKGPDLSPSVQITIENGESGDYWEFVDKNLDGFEIIFYDKTDVAVSRVFDAQIKGFGRKSAYVI
jgi:Putative phage tail protein